jgi:hypothetical protein
MGQQHENSKDFSQEEKVINARSKRKCSYGKLVSTYHSKQLRPLSTKAFLSV